MCLQMSITNDSVSWRRLQYNCGGALIIAFHTWFFVAALVLLCRCVRRFFHVIVIPQKPVISMLILLSKICSCFLENCNFLTTNFAIVHHILWKEITNISQLFSRLVSSAVIYFFQTGISRFFDVWLLGGEAAESGVQIRRSQLQEISTNAASVVCERCRFT